MSVKWWFRVVSDHQDEYVEGDRVDRGQDRVFLRDWVRQAERDAGLRAGMTSDERGRLKEAEREVKKLRRATEMLREASAYIAQAELGRPPRR